MIGADRNRWADALYCMIFLHSQRRGTFSLQRQFIGLNSLLSLVNFLLFSTSIASLLFVSNFQHFIVGIASKTGSGSSAGGRRSQRPPTTASGNIMGEFVLFSHEFQPTWLKAYYGDNNWRKSVRSPLASYGRKDPCWPFGSLGGVVCSISVQNAVFLGGDAESTASFFISV